MNRACLLALIILLQAGCSTAGGDVESRQFFAFGTLIDSSYYGVDAATADAATQALEAMFLAQHNQWHAWEPGALTALNHAIANRQPHRTPDSIITLIRLGQQYETRSHGLFNPAIGRLLRLWGFQQDDVHDWRPPEAARVQELVARAPSSLQLSIDGSVVRSSNPAVQLDFGAFAKGYAIGEAIERLHRQGVHHALVNAGGDLCVSGRRGMRNWRIGIRHPRKPGVIASIELEPDSCIFTSGDYERFSDRNGKRIHHILNPKTGYSATGTQSVTVIANNPTLADAAATALFVAGPDNWHDIAVAMNIHYVMLVDSQGLLHMNPAMATLLQIGPDEAGNIRISAPLPLPAQTDEMPS